ncbi:MAG: ABC transporter substrate-binding protein [Candidatus Cloacimonadales bacterium]|nr:ABC transporter substrate-binding protein [Candidatus Cloacimonadales bacterium]
MKKLLIGILVLLILSSCGTNQSGKLRIGIISPSLNHFPLDFAFKFEILKQNDFVVKKFSSGWETNEALVAGKIDLAILPFTYVWSDVAQGRNVKIISFLERESDGIIAKKDIEKISDLDGRKIGVLRASTLDIFAEMLADEHQIKPEFVYFRSPMEMAAALNAGEVDALSFYVPPIFNFNSRFHILHWYSADHPHHPCCDLAATESALANKTEQIRKFLRSLKESCSELVQDPQVAFETIQTSYRISLQTSKNSLYNTKYIMNLEESGRDFEEKAVRKMIEKGYIETNVKPEDVYFEFE